MAIAASQYFSRKRGLANGIIFAGGGLGGAVNSFALNALLHRVGPAWTFRCLALMTLGTGLPAAFLIKERVPYRKSSIVEWYATLSARSNQLASWLTALGDFSSHLHSS